MQAASRNVSFPAGPARRTSAETLKQQILGFLGQALPAGWTAQPLQRGPAVAADILVVSPRGRCHFLFVLAPADRWWDGGPHSVPAERFSAAAAALARRLRAAGHRARAVWTARDLERALAAWGCPPAGRVRLGTADEAPPVPRSRPPRPKLHLAGWGGREHG